jgi:hypothetical protein
MGSSNGKDTLLRCGAILLLIPVEIEMHKILVSDIRVSAVIGVFSQVFFLSFQLINIHI